MWIQLLFKMIVFVFFIQAISSLSVQCTQAFYSSNQIAPRHWNVTMYQSDGQYKRSFVHHSRHIYGFLCSNVLTITVHDKCYTKNMPWYNIFKYVVLGFAVFSIPILNLINSCFKKTKKKVMDAQLQRTAKNNQKFRQMMQLYLNNRQELLMTDVQLNVQQVKKQGKCSKIVLTFYQTTTKNYGCSLLSIFIFTLAVLALPQVIPGLTVMHVCQNDCVKIPPHSSLISMNMLQSLTVPIVHWNTSVVIMETDCSASYYSGALNVNWTVPANNIQICTSVTASVLTKIVTGYNSWCSWQSNIQIDYGGSQGHFGQQVQQHVGVSQCFWQNKYTYSWMQWYGQDNVPNWKLCNQVKDNNTAVSRMTVNGSTSYLPLSTTITNPLKQYALGYYTNGTDIIAIQSGNHNTLSGSIGFNTTIEKMAMSHWIAPGQKSPPRLTPMDSTFFAPRISGCKAVVVLQKNSSWTQFNTWCATPTLDNSTGKLIVSAKDPNICNIVLQDRDGKNSTVTVGNGSYLSQQATPFLAWNCYCSGACGGIIVNFSSCIVNFQEQSVVNVTYPVSQISNYPSSSSQLGQHIDSIFGEFWIVILSCVGFVLLFMVFNLFIVPCYKKKSTQNKLKLINHQPTQSLKQIKKPRSSTFELQQLA